MADYNLGTAHGTIRITYEGKETQAAKRDADQAKKSFDLMGTSLRGLSSIFSQYSNAAKGSAKDTGSLYSEYQKLSTGMKLAAGAGLALLSTFKAMSQAMAIAKGVGVISAAFAGMGASVNIVQGLAGALSQLSGVVGLIPGGVAMAAAAMGTWTLAMSGVSDSFKAVFDDQKKFDKATKDLSANAKSFFVTLRGMKTELLGLKNVAQDAVFAGFDKQLQAISKATLPTLNAGVKNVGTALNGAAMQVAAFVQKSSTVKDIGAIFTATGTTIRNLSPAIQPALQIFTDLAVVGSKVLTDLSAGVAPVIQRWAQFISTARQTGQLEAWIKRGVQALKDLAAIAGNVGSVLKSLFTGLGTGDGATFLTTLRGATQALAEFMKTAQTQSTLQALGQIFRSVLTTAIELFKQAVTTLGPIIKSAVPVVAQLAEGIKNGLVAAMHQAAPIIQGIISALGPMAPTLGVIVGYLVGFGLAAKGVSLLLAPFRMLASLAVGMVGGVSATYNALKLLGTGAIAAGKGIASGTVAMAGMVKSGAQTAAIAAMYAADWVKMATAATVNGAKAAGAWLLLRGQQAGSAVASMAATAAGYVAQWAKMAAGALVNGAKAAGAWALATGSQAASAIGTMAAQAATFIGHWVRVATQAAINGAKTATAWVLATGTQAATAVATMAAQATAFIGHWIRVAAAATLNAIKTAGAWAITTGAAAATAIATMAVTAAQFVAGWVMMGVQSTIQAARVAAAWIIAMGPVAWITAAVIALVALIIANWDTIKAATIAAWTAVSTAVSTAFNAIVTWVTTKAAQIATMVTTAWTNLKTSAAAAWAAITTAVSTGVNAVVSFVTSLPGRIASIASSLWESIKSGAAAAWEAISSTVSSGVQSVVSFVQELPSQISSIASSAWESLKSGASAAWEALKSGAQTAVQSVVQFFQGLPGMLTSALGNAATWLVNVGREIVNGLWAGIQAGWAWLTGMVANLAKSLLAAAMAALGINSPSKEFIKIGASIIEGWGDGLTGGIGHLVGIVGGIIKKILGVWGWSKPKPGDHGGGPKPPPPPVEPPPPPPPPSTGVGWNPFTRPTGASWAPDPFMQGPINITIDAKTVAEINTVTEFFDTVKQTARAGRA